MSKPLKIIGMISIILIIGIITPEMLVSAETLSCVSDAENPIDFMAICEKLDFISSQNERIISNQEVIKAQNTQIILDNQQIINNQKIDLCSKGLLVDQGRILLSNYYQELERLGVKCNLG